MALSTASTMTPTSAKMAAHMSADADGHQRQARELHHQREHDVLVHDADAFAGDPDGLGDLQRLVVHQHDVGGLDGGVAAHGAHGDADVGTAQHGGVVDAVAHEGQLARLPWRPSSSSTLLTLSAGSRSLCTSSTPSSAATDSATRLGVAGEHDGLVHAGLMQGGDGLLGVGLHHVGDDDVTGVLAVHGHVDDGADAVAVVVGDAQLLHELAVAGGDGYAVHLGGDAVAAELLEYR